MGILLLLIASHFSFSIVLANGSVLSESLSLTTYLDGYVLVEHELQLNQTSPSVNVTLLCEAYEEILIVDEQSLPLDYKLADGTAIINSLDAAQIHISYFTSDLTSKTGKYWTLTAKLSTNATIVLPEDTSVISLNTVPELIESTDGQVTLVMPMGTLEVTYIAEPSFFQEKQGFDIWLLIALVSIPILASVAFAVWVLRQKKSPPPMETAEEVDVGKLFEKEKYLRPEETQVLRFLAEKHGTAFEAELYSTLNLPRTTMWRLIKRLQKMEIVDVKKARRQNIVTIKRKYMKKLQSP